MNKFDLTEKARGYQRSVDELAFLEANYLMGFEALSNLLLSNPNSDDIIIIYGGEITVAGQDFTITEGRAFYQNEIFEIEANAFTAPSGESAVFVLDEVDINLKFQDASTHRARVLRKLKLQSGLAGTGLKDYNAIKRRLQEFTPKSNSGPTLVVNRADYMELSGQIFVNMDFSWNAIESSGSGHSFRDMPFAPGSGIAFLSAFCVNTSLSWSVINDTEGNNNVWELRRYDGHSPTYAELASQRFIVSGSYRKYEL